MLGFLSVLIGLSHIDIHVPRFCLVVLFICHERAIFISLSIPSCIGCRPWMYHVLVLPCVFIFTSLTAVNVFRKVFSYPDIRNDGIGVYLLPRMGGILAGHHHLHHCDVRRQHSDPSLHSLHPGDICHPHSSDLHH